MFRTLPARTRGGHLRLLRLVAPLTVILAVAPTAPRAVELVGADIPSHPDAEQRYLEHHDPDRLDSESWILLPDGTSFQAIGDRARQAAEECVELMKQNGWTLRRENWQSRGGEFWFRKEVVKDAKLSVGTAGKPIAGKMQNYVLIRHELKRLVPTVGLKGIDIPDAPRYPGAVRVRWMNLMGDFAAKYLIAGSLEDVKAFYEKELPKHGWQPSRGVGTLNYTKGGVKTPDELAPEDKQIGKPLEMIEKMIPSTLAVHLDDEDGIVHIGLGRSAGAADLEEWATLPVSPPRPPAEKPRELLTFIDPEADLPVFAGLNLESTRNAPMSPGGEEIVTLVYKKQAPPAEAIEAAEFYMAEMAARGWTLLDEEWHGLHRKLVYRKGAVRVEIDVKAVGQLSIRESPRPIPIPVEVKVILPVPTRDVAGEDIEGVPRIPGSVRFYYLKVAMDTIAKFKTVASKDQAEWFFIDELPKNGWTFAGNDTTGLLFVPTGTAQSATQAFAEGQLVPTTLKIIVDDMEDGTLKIGTALNKGDT